MSFILNALRKSEQERQALQSDTVTDKILLPQPPQHHGNTTKLFAFLIIVNILIIACFGWFIRNSLISPPETTAPVISKPLPTQNVKLESKAIAKSIEPKRPVHKTEFETVSIAELIDGEKRESAPLPAKPLVAKKPVAESAIAKYPNLPISETPAIAPAKTQPDALQTLPVTTDIPFLNDLPSEFRQTVPKFTLNVFVYSPVPDERFVMVDMVKYKTGQQIKDALLLKEILPDSFVVDYRNRTFKIKRP